LEGWGRRRSASRTGFRVGPMGPLTAKPSRSGRLFQLAAVVMQRLVSFRSGGATRRGPSLRYLPSRYLRCIGVDARDSTAGLRLPSIASSLAGRRGNSRRLPTCGIQGATSDCVPNGSRAFLIPPPESEAGSVTACGPTSAVVPRPRLAKPRPTRSTRLTAPKRVCTRNGRQ
jgi:hypothetical protein